MKSRIFGQINNKNIYLLLLAFGMVAGTFFANALSGTVAGELGMFDQNGLELLSGATPDVRQLFDYVVKSRVRLFFFVVLCGMTRIAMPCLYCMLLAGGFAAGAMVSVATMQLGGWGVLLVAASLFPQWIFYCAALWIIARVLYEMRGKEKAPAYGLAFLAVVAGVAAEVLVNPVLVKNLVYLIY